jgi:hypothetical protein
LLALRERQVHLIRYNSLGLIATVTVGISTIVSGGVLALSP